MPPACHFDQMWSTDASNPGVMVDCLLPTGVLIQMSVYKDSNLRDIKQALWREAVQYPLYKHLHDVESYIFMCINQTAEQEELLDESKRLCDVRPFQPVLKVIEKPDGGQEERQLKSQIGGLIGKGLGYFDTLKNDEIIEYRSKLRKFSEDIAKQRPYKAWNERALQIYPPDVYSSPEVSSTLKAKLARDNNQIIVYALVYALGEEVRKAIRIDANVQASHLVKETLSKLTSSMGHDIDEADDYVLKCCGKEEYLLGSYPLIQYRYVRTMVTKEISPQFLLLHKKYVHGVYHGPPLLPPKGSSSSGESTPKINHRTSRKWRRNDVSLWTVNEKYSIKIRSIKNVHEMEGTKVRLRVGLFHGTETLCDILNTDEAVVTNSQAQWNERLTFDLPAHNLPRMTRLCFSLYALLNSKKDNKSSKMKIKEQNQEIVPLSWVNTMVFDYRDKLPSGDASLNMWPFKRDVFDLENILNPVGTVIENSSSESSNATLLSFTFQEYGAKGPIIFPSFDKILECAADHMDETDSNALVTQSNLEQLEQFIQKDSLHLPYDQEKELIWSLREECRYRYPKALSKLLKCVKWNSHIDVAKMQSLLQIWGTLPPDIALELLDIAYPEKTVRDYAVKCLRELRDAELLHYILQLIQALKYESYLDCSLVDFLLERALNNMKIGHQLFWLLRSEMHDPSVAVRFGIMLEAYLRGSYNHMQILLSQTSALNKLQSVNVLVKSDQYKKTRDRGMMDMRAVLGQDVYRETLSDLISPLNPSFKLKHLRVPECKFMDSKMKPLWLVWENASQYGEDVKILYKNGDDLRQDMLTLQLISIMDEIWLSEGLDLRMIPYGCISTGPDQGLIEVVQKSQTLANIQKQNSSFAIKSAFNKLSLYQWLSERNTNKEDLNRAIEEFTLSCAGYSVATYVLGVADRHSDNIMLKENGQLFHIDFGHFLGNFKTKFGIKRERVPFVLTHEMIYVIKEGKDNPFDRFRHLCEKAFLALRRQGTLLFTLFVLMISSGLPELRKLNDIKHLRSTLRLDMSDDDALDFFRKKFNEALANSWKTSVNFAAHNLAKNNV